MTGTLRSDPAAVLVPDLIQSGRILRAWSLAT